MAKRGGLKVIPRGPGVSKGCASSILVRCLHPFTRLVVPLGDLLFVHGGNPSFGSSWDVSPHVGWSPRCIGSSIFIHSRGTNLDSLWIIFGPCSFSSIMPIWSLCGLSPRVWGTPFGITSNAGLKSRLQVHIPRPWIHDLGN